MASIFKSFQIHLVLILLSANSFGQGNEVYIKDGACSTTIRLNHDNTYNYQMLCEGLSNTSFGTWIQKKDTIKFTPLNTGDFKILNIASGIEAGAKELTVKVFDQKRNNITNRLTIKQYVKRKGYYILQSDSTKTMRTDLFRDSGTVIIESLERTLNGSFGVQVDSFTNFQITVNVPNDLVFNIGPDWVNTGNFELIKTKDALQSVKTYPADGNKKPFKIIYKKQTNTPAGAGIH